MEKNDPVLESNFKRLSSLRSFDFWENNRIKIWILGFILRILFTPFTLYDADYKQHRIPVVTGLGGLRNSNPVVTPLVYPTLS
ncbi:MAG: hypothetical protein ACW98K_05770 [Candidatus Kariarchaeaceae archaeon]|jgi:hypothetical protein